jgi:hypothetical protein
MSTLSTLKLTAVQKPTHIAPVQMRRNKLAKRLWEQEQLAQAQASGSHYSPIKLRTITDSETGTRKQIETYKRVKPWWFTADNGKLSLCVKYGVATLELAKGKFAVEVTGEKELAPTLAALRGAVLAGELDTAIDAAANALKSNFSK